MHLESWGEVDNSLHRESSCGEEMGPRWLIESWSDTSSTARQGPGDK